MLTTEDDVLAAGRLRQRVVILKRVEANDGQGGKSWDYQTRASNVAAEVRPISGREGLIAQQVTAVLDSTVVIRWRADVAVTDRIVWGSRTLQVQSVQNPDGKHIALTLLCSEVQP